MMNKAELVAHLRALGLGRALPYMEEGGICYEVDRLVSGGMYLRVRGYMKEWPEFSGGNVYPVPHPHYSPFEGFNCSSNSEMWHSGEYAEARKRLCLFLADRLEQEGNDSVE